MTARLCCVLAGVLVVAAAPPARDEQRLSKREQDPRKDLLALQGTWQLESIENSKKARIDVKKRTLFVGGELMLMQEGDKITQAGVLRLVANKSPRCIDVVVKKGEHEDNTMLGIYDIDGDTLRMCFDPEGESRPKKFQTKSDSAVYVVTYRRVKRTDEVIDIAGKYRCETFGPDNKKATLTTEISKRGDAYLLTWQVSGGVAFIGTGIRHGDTLSVAWLNRGTAGVTVFKIEKGPKLVGQYTEVGGPGLVSREVLTANNTKWVEVRRR